MFMLLNFSSTIYFFSLNEQYCLKLNLQVNECTVNCSVKVCNSDSLHVMVANGNDECTLIL